MTEMGTVTYGGSILLSNTVTMAAVQQGWLRITGAISGNDSVVIGNGGVIEFAGANTYTGDTVINGNGAILVVNNTNGSAGGTGVVAPTMWGLLAGTGTVSNLKLADNGIFSPGPQISLTTSNNIEAGRMTVGNWTWENTGQFQWELVDASVNSTNGWDFVKVLNTLALNGSNQSLVVNLHAWNPDNFDPTGSYSFLVARADQITGFSSNAFKFVGNYFWPQTNGWGFIATTNQNPDGTWNLYFDYVKGGQMFIVIPEPNVLLLWVSSLATIYAARRRLMGRKKKK
jgi:hypothetical protein